MHGLNGSPRSTWEYGVDTSTSEQSTKVGSDGSRLSNFFYTSGNKRGKVQDSSTATAGGALSVFWPVDILSHLVPKARIWTYGYNADVFGGFFKKNNLNSVLNHANDFKVKIRRELRDDVSAITTHEDSFLTLFPETHRFCGS